MCDFNCKRRSSPSGILQVIKLKKYESLADVETSCYFFLYSFAEKTVFASSIVTITDATNNRFYFHIFLNRGLRSRAVYGSSNANTVINLKRDKTFHTGLASKILTDSRIEPA